jgi:polyhydroxyalkanoate synthesis regulator phasin
MSEDNTSDDKQKTARTKVSDGIKQGIGVLSAFKDALEETINDARERGDLSSDKAKDVMKNALNKAQEAAEGARERLDFVSQKEFAALGQAVDAVKDRVSALEARFSGKEADAEAPEDSGEGT